MEPIKAFVAHSFTEDDADVVAVILKYLSRVAELHPRFSWQHAEHPEPTMVDAKVLALFADKNLFIGICTRKERVIAPSALSQSWFARKSLTAKESDVYWKTSDWIIQEVGLAIGRGMKIILLIEEGTRSPGSLQGNLEYIPFNRNVPEKCFDRFLGMIAALSPQAASGPVTAQEAKPLNAQDSDAMQAPVGNDWTTPKADWKKQDYEFAFMHFIATRNKSEEKHINELFLASDEGGADANRKDWVAYGEFIRIIFDRGGDLAKLELLFENSPDSSEIAARLAESYLHYEEYQKAANAFQRAADTASDVRRQIKLLGEAALCHQKAGNEYDALALAIRMRQRSEETGQGEIEVLKAQKMLAEERKEDEAELAALERLLDLSPGDDDTRFSLAYKYSTVNQYDLAAFHYSRIPSSNRNEMAWNNLGVALGLLGMPIKSVTAYRESEKLGETLAMSNLAIKFLDAGFLREAQEILDTALKIKDHHKNIDKTLGTVKDALDDEDRKKTSSHEKAKPISEYYKQFGHSLARPLTLSIVGQWNAPNCRLELSVNGTSVVAIGSYEVAGLGLLGALAFSGGAHSRNDPVPLRYVVEYRGDIRGRTIIGSVSRRQEGGLSKKPSTLLIGSESDPTILMWISDIGDKIHVLERNANSDPRFYEFHRL